MTTFANPDNSRTYATDALRLTVVGADLLLSGRFEHWVPMAVDTSVPAEKSVQLLVDVTSSRQSADQSTDEDALTLTARNVRKIAPLTYRLRGTLTADGVSQDVEAMLQTPQSHTPFCLLTLTLPSDEFAGLWSRVDAHTPRNTNGAARRTDDGAPVAADEPNADNEMRARAWLRPPTIAAA